MTISKDKIIYSAADNEGDEVKSFLHATLKLTSTTVSGKEALDVNIVSAIMVDLNGFYDVSTNATPDTVGNIMCTRAATPALTDQIQRVTAAAAASDAVVAANVHGQDVNAFAMAYNGTTWDRLLATGGKLQVLADGTVADDGVDAGNPIKVGSRAVSGALTAVSTSGDRADLLSDLYRRVWVNTAPNIAGSNAAVSVTDTAGGTALFASPLAGRRKVRIQNLGLTSIYMGFGTVTAVNGSRLAAGATEDLEMGPDLAFKALASTAVPCDVRVIQLA